MGKTAPDDPEIKKRAGIAWRVMEFELGKVLDFERRHTGISKSYRNLP